jgi:nitrite reductase/ring-hydroxylating ferredoxin subunit
VKWHRVLSATELPESTPTGVVLEGRELCVVRLKGELHAFDDACPHRQWPLHLGSLNGPVLTCRAHTWEWDVRDGSLQRMRAPTCLQMHAARERDGSIEVSIDERSGPPLALSRLWLRSREGDAVTS